TYLAGNNNSAGQLFGPRLSAPGSMVSIAMVTDGLRWANDGGAQTDASLRSTANYLIWLCGIYGQQAEYISQGAGGGTVIPGSVPTLDPIDWVVGATASGTAPLANGQYTVTLDGTGGMPDLRGYNIDFFKGGFLQYTTNPGDGSNYYTWSKVTGVFTLFPNAPGAVTDDQLRISPIGL
ncbi:MAG: hypothetical protein ACRC78_00460, partial [Planktothrix sp.]